MDTQETEIYDQKFCDRSNKMDTQETILNDIED